MCMRACMRAGARAGGRARGRVGAQARGHAGVRASVCSCVRACLPASICGKGRWAGTNLPGQPSLGWPLPLPACPRACLRALVCLCVCGSTFVLVGVHAHECACTCMHGVHVCSCTVQMTGVTRGASLPQAWVLQTYPHPAQGLLAAEHGRNSAGLWRG